MDEFFDAMKQLYLEHPVATLGTDLVKVAVGFVGPFLVHALTKRRDREQRVLNRREVLEQLAADMKHLHSSLSQSPLADPESINHGRMAMALSVHVQAVKRDTKRLGDLEQQEADLKSKLLSDNELQSRMRAASARGGRGREQLMLQQERQERQQPYERARAEVEKARAELRRAVAYTVELVESLLSARLQENEIESWLKNAEENWKG